ncbi:MAG TPA: LacI family DNA-binding transcriptional regulator, partial [Candidatus Eisenbacteria bacterium]
MTVTIREVAKQAKVSVATVSRVFTGKSPVRDETRLRVRQVAERLHYLPHGAARSLITRRTMTVGVLLPDLHGEFFSEVIRGIVLRARKSGYHLLVSSSHSDISEIEATIATMRGRVDGLILMSPDMDAGWLHAKLPARLPIVLLNAAGDTGPFETIGVDNRGGAFAMTRHLLALGHRRIAIVRGPEGNRDAAERLRGWRWALQDLPGGDTEGIEVAGDFTEAAGERAAAKILAREPRPTAVFAANDAMAIGLLAALRERDVRVPEEIAVAGFDDIPIARYVSPPLTSVRIPIAALGALAVERLLAAFGEDGEPERTHETLATELVVRASC